MGYFYMDVDIMGSPPILDLREDKFRVLIESACRYNRTRDPKDAPPAEFMHHFKFPKRKIRRHRGKSHDRHALFVAFGGVCYLCNTRVDYGEFEIEHVVPIARGGADELSNLGIAHKMCNLRKGAKLLSELDWYRP